MKGIESTIVGGVSYDVEWVLIDSYLEQGHSVILDSPCLYEGMVEKGIKLSNKHGVKYKYIECYLNDMEEINSRLQTRKRMVSQIEKVESELAFKKWLNGSKRPLNSEYIIVNSSEPLERYAEKMMDYMRESVIFIREDNAFHLNIRCFCRSVYFSTRASFSPDFI